MASLNPLSDAFGIDIGDRSFKLVQVSKGHGEKPYRISAWGSVDVPDEAMERGDIKDVDKAASYVARLLAESAGHVRGRAVVACLPEAKTFIKIIELAERTDEAGLRAAVMKEIEQNIPLPPSEIYFDWQVLDDTPRPIAPVTDAEVKPEEFAPGEDNEEPVRTPPAMRILMGAAPKTLVDDYSAVLEKAGLTPIAFEIEAMAIARALTGAKDDLRGEPVGLLDIGATRSSLVIYDDGAPRMSISIPISGIAITKMVSESLNVNMDDAETLKRECGLDATRCEDKMWNILLPLIDDMTDKVRNALRFYRLGFPEGRKIERLVLCGGGAQFREIDTVLSRKLTIKVRKGDALANINPRLPKDFPRSDAALTYTTAIGLAMRAVDDMASSKSAF